MTATRRGSGDAGRVSRLPHRSDQRTGSAWHGTLVLALLEVRRRVESRASARSKPRSPARANDASEQRQRLLAQQVGATLCFARMKITDLRATTVAVPLEAPLRHANGCHWGRFVRTIVEVETDTGLIGLGEMGGGGESAVAGIRALEVVSRRSRSRAARGDAVPARESDRVALQQPHADGRGASSSPASICSDRRGACPCATSSAAASAIA